MPTVAYIACPYTPVNKSNEIGLSKPDTSERDAKTKEERFNKVNKAAARLYKAGITTINPIGQSHLLHKDHGLEGSFEFWMPHNYALIERCDMLIVLMLPGWKESEGVVAEIKFALSKNIPVIYIDEEMRIGG